VWTTSSIDASEGTTRRASRVETAISGRQATSGIDAGTVVRGDGEPAEDGGTDVVDVGLAGDDGLALARDGDEFLPRQPAVVEFVETDGDGGGTRSRRAESRGRADALVDLDVGGRVERFDDGTDRIAFRVFGDELAARTRDLDGRLVGLLDTDHVRRVVEGHTEDVESAPQVGTRRRGPHRNHALRFLRSKQKGSEDGDSPGRAGMSVPKRVTGTVVVSGHGVCELGSLKSASHLFAVTYRRGPTMSSASPRNR
jgi:hypothetical protein